MRIRIDVNAVPSVVIEIGESAPASGHVIVDGEHRLGGIAAILAEPLEPVVDGDALAAAVAEATGVDIEAVHAVLAAELNYLELLGLAEPGIHE